MKNKSRFAPSPSGLLHVGNARSAVLNWAYIENLGGDFILRIDDTDKERSKKDYEIKIKEDLKWLGIEWKKTFNQSDNDKIYSQKIEYLKKIVKFIHALRLLMNYLSKKNHNFHQEDHQFMIEVV